MDTLMIDDDFGGPPAPAAPDNVIPFPGMRPNEKLTDAWAREVESFNKKNNKRHRFVSPMDVVNELVKMRGMPTMPWPAVWPELGSRARTYVGECNSFVGSIGGGKTQRAVQLGMAVAAAGLPVLWLNLELGREQLLARQLGNLTGEHAYQVLDDWGESRIRHHTAAFSDMWHFVDRYTDTDEQLAAVRDAIDMVWRVYRLPPLFVVDHMGQHITQAKDARLEMTRVGQQYERIALETKSWGMLLAQGTKSGQQLLTGKIEIENAAEAIGAAAEASVMQQVCSNVIVSQLYKEDDAITLEGRDLLAKARWTGREGQIGVRYSKPGGQWFELGHLPPTPAETRAAEEAEKKDTHRTEPPRSRTEIRKEMSASRADTADAIARANLLKSIRDRGQFGLEEHVMRNMAGLRGAKLHGALAALEGAALIERANGGRWRMRGGA